MTNNITHYDAVEAYCGQLSYAPGETVDIRTSCATESYDVSVQRWGGPDLWAVKSAVGVRQDTPANADSHGCGWDVSLQFGIPQSWPSGFYLITLTAQGAAADRAMSYACFVVRAGVQHADILLVVATNTYNAYNNWGGRSLYTGGNRVSFDRPFGRGMLIREVTDRDDRKARPRYRGEDPDTDGRIYEQYRNERGLPAYAASAGWFTYERQFVQWAQTAGIALDFAVSSDLETRPSVADGYALVVSVGHDEYWSAPQRDALEEHIRGGGNFASLSGNTSFWQVRLEDAGRSMVCHKYAAHLSDPVLGTPEERTMTGMWADPIVGKPETALLGAGSAWGLYSRFGQATPRGAGGFTVYRHDHWIFDGTGLRYGDVLGADHGVLGYETVGCRIGFDEYQLPIAAGGDGTPAEIEIVAFTPSSNLAMGEYPKSIAALNDQGDLEFISSRLHGRLDDDSLARHRYGNAVIVTCRPFGPDGGEVVTIGSTDWVYGLSDRAVDRVTRNVLNRLSQPGRGVNAG